MIKRSTRTLAMTCTLDQPRLQSCRLKLKAGRRTLASARADAAPDTASVKVRLPIGKRTRRLARRPGGQAATLTPAPLNPAAPTSRDDCAAAAPTRRHQRPQRRNVQDRQREAAARRHALSAPPARPDHRRPPDHLHGHTDNRGSTKSNRRLGRARAQAVCTFLTANTTIKTRTRSQGETHPRAPNTTAAGRARNRYVAIAVRY